MDTAFYTETDITIQGDAAAAELAAQVVSAAACAGPWSVELQHGGPPTALLVRAAERLAAAASGRTDLAAMRIATDFLAPVPVAELAVSARVLRLARSAVLISAELAGTDSAGVIGRPFLQARVWLLAEGERPAEADGLGAEDQLGEDSNPAGEGAPAVLPDGLAPFEIFSFPYVNHLEWRVVTGSAHRPGPAVVWVRPRIPLVAGEQLSPLQRLALIADSASGVSAELDWDEWSFANVDLDVHLLRPVRGEWLLLDARTRLGTGVGMASSTLWDADGVVGGGLQTLLLRRHRR